MKFKVVVQLKEVHEAELIVEADNAIDAMNNAETAASWMVSGQYTTHKCTPVTAIRVKSK